VAYWLVVGLNLAGSRKRNCILQSDLAFLRRPIFLTTADL
jgi:hypothetical protein